MDWCVEFHKNCTEEVQAAVKTDSCNTKDKMLLCATLSRELVLPENRWRDWQSLLSTAQTQHQMEGRFFLDIIIGQRPSILQLFPGKNEPLLGVRKSFFVLDFCLHIVDGVGSFDPM